MVLVLSLVDTFQCIIQPFINILSSLLSSKAQGSGLIQKIQGYYDKGGVPSEIIPEMLAKKENYISNKELPRK